MCARAAVRHWVVIANPENRRVGFIQEALAGWGIPPATVVPWIDVLQESVPWEKVLRSGAVVRIDSSGENAEVERALIAAGADAAEQEGCADRIPHDDALQLPEDHGCIRFLRQRHLGFCAALDRIDAALYSTPGILRLQPSGGVRLMFDKVACQSALASAGVPVPKVLGRVTGYDELLVRMHERRIQRVFIKPAHGSSASGVIAYERSGARELAHTSVEIVRKDGNLRLYNSLKVRRYDSPEDIAPIVNTLARQGVQVEAWIPKATVGGRCFDLRVVVIAGRARHVVVRTSRSPMTNLHLGNRRCDLEEVHALLGPEAWNVALLSCEQAMRVFPGTLYAGLDLLIAHGLKRHAILEANAFGDLLPHVTCDGLSTYEAEIQAVEDGSFDTYQALPADSAARAPQGVQ